MQTIALSFHRFEGFGARAWAFAQMGLSRRALAALPGLEFFKMFGTGTGEGFTPVPNLGVYVLMTVWPDLATARRQVAEAQVFQRYRSRAAEQATLYLSAISSRGAWDGSSPFRCDESQPRSPVAVITRATLRRSSLRGFWSQVPAIEATIREETRGKILFKMGMGEVPWFQQVTFSIWRDEAEMTEFAYRSDSHRGAIRNVRDGNWFREELYARFAVTGAEGVWEGRNLPDRIPVAGQVADISSFA